MQMPDNGEISKAIGRQKKVRDFLSERQLDLLDTTLSGLLDDSASDNEAFRQDCPHGWQWTFFHEPVPKSRLGRDGHEKLGEFIPKLPLKRRMWAGGTITFHALPVTGRSIERITTLSSVTPKKGHSGDLVFVTLTHEISQSGTKVLSEIQNLVYREEARPGNSEKPAGKPAPLDSDRQITFLPDPVSMFRYSALTFNGHRIHYDADYARDVDGYQGIVFHGPLTATLLMKLAAMMKPGLPLKSFTFRGTSPIDTFDPVTLHAKDGKSGVELWAAKADGTLAMQAQAGF